MTHLRQLLPALAIFTSLAAQDYRPAPPMATSINPSGNWFRFDLDGNGQADSVVADFGFGLSVILNPTLTAPTANVTTVYTPFAAFISNVYFEDMNSDGHTDIALEVDGTFVLGEMLYLPGDGMGGFGSEVSIALASDKAIYAEVGDFNGDGQTDAAYIDVPRMGPLTLHVLTQNNGVFTTAHSVTVPNTLRGLESGDFDGDGADDLVWYGGGSLQILAGTTGSFAAPVTRTIDPALNDGFASDLDHDGLDDLVLQEVSFAGWRINAYFGATTNYLEMPQVVVPSGNPARCDFLGPFDVDADGNDELLCVLRNTGGYSLIRTDGARGFSPTPYLTTMDGGLIDLDQDGDLDQLRADFFGSGYFREENLASYGAACAGTNGAPRIQLEAAIPGNGNFAMTIRNAAPYSLAQMFLSGGAAISGNCGPQIQFGRLIFPFVGSPLFFGITDGTGSLRTPLPLPTGLPDGPFFMQGVIIDAMGSLQLTSYNLATTGGRTIRIY